MAAFDVVWRRLARWAGERPLPAEMAQELLCALGLLSVMRADLRVPVSGLVTVSDASMRQGAVCRSVRLTDAGLSLIHI
eukprot:6390719-Alexandrium_andersonii.AAC.1